MVQPAVHFRRSLVLPLAFLFSVCSLSYQQLLVFGLADVTGDFVLSQSLGLGAYLLGMGLGTWRLDSLGKGLRPARLAAVEMTLSLLGFLSIFSLYGGEILFKYFFAYFPAQWILFLFLPFIGAVGYFTGQEVPLLIRLNPEVSQAKILGWTYFGALTAMAIMPLFLLPRLDLPKAVFLVALLNFSLAYLLVAAHGLSWRRQAAALVLALALLPWLRFESTWRDFHLKFIYFPVAFNGWDNLLGDVRRFDEVDAPLRRRSPYQWIDLIPRGASGLTGEENDFSVYLDRKFQFSAQTQIRYHEAMVHGGVNLLGRVPARVLILGGGDGLLLPHILKYPEVQSVTIVELDGEMLELARRHKELSRLNGDGLKDARVRTIEGDAFRFVRRAREDFDLVLIDFPLPTTYDLSVLYSREFYSLVRKVLGADGVMLFDFALPDRHLDGLAVLLHTLRASGFGKPLAFGQEDLFLALTPADRELRFDFDRLAARASNQSLLSFSSQQEFVDAALAKPARINSIFFPHRFTFDYSEAKSAEGQHPETL